MRRNLPLYPVVLSSVVFVPPFYRSHATVCLVLGTWLVAGLLGITVHAQNLESFPHCTLVNEPWADGDSFPVRFPDGQVRTIRLYGVDCLESHVEGSDTNARRLRDQRRWFGIPDMQTALDYGKRGTTETQRQLAHPFTVHTAFADGRGDARFARIYGFVTTSTGTDLAEHLVSVGLARAFGVVRGRPDGTRGDEWREQLKDLELRAAKAGAGAWQATDWERLSEERRAARLEEAEIAELRSPGAGGPPDEPINPNTASRDELLSLPGVGEVTALRIIEARPYQSVEDLLRVPGIGPKTLESIRKYLQVAAPILK